jgi:1-acyl-sn-glycerol-3-phosphate acyltransferase
MSEHLQKTFLEAIAKNETIVFSSENSITKHLSKVVGRLWFYWIFVVVGCLFLFGMPLVMLYAELLRNRDLAYPWARWGARTWLKLSGMKVLVSGTENLDANQSYVFVANHHSYLDTAVMFAYTGKKMGVIAKKEMLKLPIGGRFMKYVNVLAIDRSNPERAVETMTDAAEKMRSGISFGVFAEGTRAMPSEFLPFKKGAFHMAIATGFPIVPVTFKNTDVLMGKKQSYAQPGTIEMIILPPFETKNLTAENDLMDLLRKVRGAIAEEMENGKWKTEN